jgi:hypothetical protein
MRLQQEKPAGPCRPGTLTSNSNGGTFRLELLAAVNQGRSTTRRSPETPLQRLPKSAAEIASLPEASSPEMDEYLAQNGRALSPETLVYLLRELVGSADRRLFHRCGELLIGIGTQPGRIEGGHCEGIIRVLAKYYGFSSPDELKEYRAACYALLWRDVVAGRVKSPHLEERFGQAFKSRAIDAARSLDRLRRRVKDTVHIDVEEDSKPEAGVASADVDSAVISAIDQVGLLAALRRLPCRQAQAAQLVWIDGWPIESEDDNEMTVSKMMGISGRMVRKHLGVARNRLQSDPSLRALLEDDGRI